MKAVVAVLVFALLALADARTVLKNKVTTASATSTAVADEGSLAVSEAHAEAKDGSDATAKATSDADDGSLALAKADAKADDGSSALATADATADDDSFAGADATAYADYWSTAIADADATADNEGEATSTAVAEAINEAKADSAAVAVADGGVATAESTAKAVGGYAKSDAKADAEGKKVYYKPKYYYVDPDEDDGDDHGYGYYPYYYNPYYLSHHGYGYFDPDADDEDKDYYYHYAHYGYYIPKVEEEEEDVTVVKFVDPALLKYYANKVYDFGCYEGKFYRCTYDDSCGKCPYGHFCGETSKTVCKAVKVWVKKCDPKTAEPVKKCKPVLSPCGKGFCKYNEKCATDYFWCGGKWCEPKYTCVAVAAPKKCTFVIVKDAYGFDKKVEKCVEYTEEACAAGKAPCPIGYECSTDPCTFVEETRKVCGEEKVPVCLPYDIPTYKDLFKPCGPGFCHPGYKCESFEHKTCQPAVDPTKIVVIPVHHYVDDVKDVDPIVHVDYDDDDDFFDDDDEADKTYYIPYTDPKSDSKATATSTSTSIAKGGLSITDVEVHATGDGSASGSADASTDNSSAWSKGKANEDVGAKIWTGSEAYDGGKGVATGTGTYEEEDD